MDQQKKHRPPGFALTFLRWFCYPPYREDIEGDLLERFYERANNMSSLKAKWLFIKDVLSLFKPGIIGLKKRIVHQKLDTMRKINWMKLMAVNFIVIVMIISPFLPGPSNKIVFWLSILGQLAGTFGLIVVAPGIAWIIIEIKKGDKNGKTVSSISFYHLAIAASIFIVLVFLAGALLLPNPMPKISFLTGGLIVLTGFIIAQRQIKKWKINGENIADQGAGFMLAVAVISCIVFIYLFTSLFILVVLE